MRIEPIYHAIAKQASKIKPVYALISNEHSHYQTIDMPLDHRLRLYANGFMTRAVPLYDTNRLDAYLSDVARYVSAPSINGDWGVFLNNKLAFHYLLSDHDEHRAAVYAVLQNGRAYPLGPSHDRVGGSDSGSEAGNWVRACLDREGTLVIKPITGGGGTNVRLCRSVDDGYVVNGTIHTAAEFKQVVTDLDEYLVCEFVEQAAYAAEIYPHSVNTMRVLTMYDAKAGEPFVPIATHRFGTAYSGKLDNFEQGGLSVGVDRDTGRLGSGIRYRPPDLPERFDTHPDTDEPIAGVEVPGWEQITTALLDIADQLSYIPYIGWDIVVTDAGEFTIIEANNNTSAVIQMHEPLLREERTRQFYERYGVI